MPTCRNLSGGSVPDDNALMQRRKRRHARGDHSLCRPDKCSDAPDAVPLTLTPVLEDGEAFLASMGALSDLPAPVRPLVERYARHVDIARHIERLLDGDEQSWVKVRVPDLGDARLIVNNVIAEHRQQSEQMRKLASEIRQAIAAARDGAGDREEEDPLARLLSAWSEEDRKSAARP